MPKDTTAIETTNADKVFDLPVNLQPGHVNTMSFPQDSISSMNLTADKQLEISFTDGSKVQVQNFQELVNSAQSCGKDTIIQLSDNTIIYPEELNDQLSKGSVAFGTADANGKQVQTFNEPPAGQIVEKNIQPGHEYKMGFDMDSTASAAQAGQNLIITFKDGGVLVMKNYFSAVSSELPPAMTLADGSVVNSDALLTSCKLVGQPSFAQTVAEETAVAKAAQSDVRAADAEPAAGEEAQPAEGAAKKSSADVEPAAGEETASNTAVADIEPAAGTPAGISGGRGGYGFASEPGAVPLNGQNPIGVIGQTQLAYTTPTTRLGPVTGNATPSIIDQNPFGAASQVTVDETNTVHTISNKVNFNFGSDGPSTTVPPVQTTGDFDFAGSAGAKLTSNGQDVTVTRVGNTYTGTAGGQTVFTLVVQSDGNYTFTQSRALDHADKTDPNDVIVLNFGVVGTDKDGDQAVTSISVNVLDDAPVAVDDAASVNPATLNVSGNVLTNDSAGYDGAKTVTAVTFNGTTVNVPANGTITVNGTYGKLVIDATGAFTYTSFNTGLGTDNFTYTMRDFDGDTATAKLDLTVGNLDSIPVIGDATSTVDETNMNPGVSVNGSVSADFKNNAPGTIEGNNSFASGGSKAGGNLTSGGVAVVVTYANGVYTGKAGNDTVFTLTVNNNGTYSFVLNKPLDHADKANPDDVINLNFGVIGKDSDGDTDTGTITINVKDDGPLAVADTGKVTAANPTITGNVTSNDDFGSDGKPTHAVTKVIFNGTTYTLPTDGSNVTITSPNGKLTINHTGQYSYTSTTTTGGVDTYTYVIADKDGDTDSVPATSTLKITVDDIDYAPTVTNDTKTVDETNMNPATSVSGSVTANYFSDGPGVIAGTNSFSSGGSKTGGNLTSGGVAVVVTYANGVYTGKAGNDTVFTLTINTDGSYNFVLNKPLDHADKANPDDVINLNFGIDATDADGDKATGTITINVKDDGPLAVADTGNVTAANPTITGNVTTNDDFGTDGKPVHAVTKVIFNGTTYTLPTDGSNVTITSANGKLTINHTGQYSYTSTTTTGGSDTYTYVIADKDGDTDTVPATSTLKITVDDQDFTPTITNDTKTVDETNMNPTTSVTGSVTANYFSDGPGAITGTNAFSSGGSKAGGNLTSGGVAVVVTYANGVYTGKAGNDTVFTLTINSNGSYTFTEVKPLDHGDKANPDDVINLNFGVVATDADGDTATGTITINVKDDGPLAVADTGNVTAANPTITGNVTTNDDFGTDGKPVHAVTKVIFNGTTYNLPTDGSNLTITSPNGKLTINHSGQYSYTATTTTGGSDTYTYVIADKDGDTDTVPATSTLKITVDDVDYTPTVTSDEKTVDETNMNPTTGISGSVTANYFDDVAGSITGTNSFSSGGSKANNALTSGGVAVVVTYANGVYTGKAGNDTVFTLTVNANGSYNFVLNKPLDHADKTNPDDVINLNFGIVATDADGDKSTNGTIKINVKDDGPLAVADTGKVTAANPTITGNVTTNDDFGSDGKPTHAVTKVIFNGTTYNLPTDGSNITITSPNGKLTINHTGQYSYTSTTTTGGSDTYTYVIADKDGDTDTVPATSTLKITVDDIDYTPTVTNDEKTVDETNMNPTTGISGSVTANYFSDGPGSITGTNSFSSGGSKAGGNLTSGGVAVVVTQVGNVYTGKAGNDTVFTLTINADGSYNFVLNKPLDHADKTNPDDVINLNFGIVATDADGDKSTNGTIKINVKDDGPLAVADTGNVTAANPTITGNVTSNDDFGSDGKPTHAVTKVIFNGTTYNLPADGSNVTITSANGKLTINHTGQYSYTSTTTNGGSDTYTYVIADKDGDTDTQPATSTLKITVDDIDYTPTVTSDEKTVDETNMNPTTGITGSVTANYFGDGPGTIAGTNTFSSGGSKANNALTSGGVAVVVTYANGVYTGKAGNDTVFTLTIGQNGSYNFVLNKPLDHADKTNPDDIIKLNFGIDATDADGDKANGQIVINVKDDGPSIGTSTATTEESDIASGTATATGSVAINYGKDGAGSFSSNGTFTATGSVLNNTLTSKGQTVTVTKTADGYIGTAGGQEVFKFTTHADGTYDFKLSRELDHADPKDPHDVITLNFGVKATDNDGDTANSNIAIKVVDDGPSVVPVPSVAVCVNNYVDNVMLPTKDYACVISMTADGQGQGGQSLQLVLSGIPSSWVFTPVVDNGNGTYTPVNSGVYNAAAGTWTLTLAPGVDFDGKFYFKPTSDADLNNITFTATVTENGQSSTQSDHFNIIVNGYDNQANGLMASSVDDSHSTETASVATSKTATNDNAHVVETHDATQDAIDHFVYSTSSASSTSSSSSSSSATADATSSTSAHAVAAPAHDDVLHATQQQSQVA